MKQTATRRGVEAADQLFWGLVYLYSQANSRKPITYTQAKTLIDVPNITVRNLGKILDVVSSICQQQHLPDLAAMVVRKSSGEPADRYKWTNPLWRESQQRVLDADWTKVERVEYLIKMISLRPPKY